MALVPEKHVEHALEVLMDKDHEASKARAAHEYLEDMKKVVLAKLKAQCNEKTVAARDDYALSHPDYLRHLEQTRSAAEEDYKHRDRRAAASAIIDAWRTEQSNQRTQGRLQ